MKKVGVLALQGDFEAHSRAVARAGAEPVLARTASDLEDLDGLGPVGEPPLDGEVEPAGRRLVRAQEQEPLAYSPAVLRDSSL